MVIRIGTWNLENFFKPPNPFAPKTEEEYQAKLDALSSAITRMDPCVGGAGGRRPGGLRRAPKDAEHASQGFERLACGLFKTHQITEGSTLG